MIHSILDINQSIGDYTVKSFIKRSQYCESYCLVDSSNEFFFLKIYDLKSVPNNNIVNSDTIIKEIDYCERLNHPNVLQFTEKGVYSSDDNYPYLITRFVDGNMVSEPLSKGRIFTLDMALSITKSILKGIVHMHSLGLIHNDITPRNILYNSKDLMSTTLIDLGHTSSISSKRIAFNASELTPFYRAPETYNNVFDTKSDIYSIAAVLYAMLFGKAPWYSSHIEDEEFCYALIKDIMRDRLSFSGGIDKCPSWLQSILKMCLSLDPNNRIQSAADFLDAIENECCPQVETSVVKTDCATSEVVAKDNTYTLSQKEGNGFADIAGMDDIKAMLQQKVLFLLKNPEKAQKYKLLPPNGMLLYGPTGCGKTFFAEKFAEEASLNYIFIKASDVGSTYIHGSQGKIAQLFADAEAKAPSVICFDEFDAMVPKRSSSDASALINPEVNEFLSQMNNCSQRGIFVIGTTNHKDLIDPAVLRTGRMDIHVEIGAPDKSTRKKMFDLYLKERPCVGVDTKKLAELTDNYSSSDISYIVNDAALVAAFKDMPIDQSMLEDSINKRPSSLGPSTSQPERRKIGF